MALDAVTVGQFNGLVLNASADEVRSEAAIDALNVDFDRRGIVRSRDGFASLGSAAASRYHYLFGIRAASLTNGRLLACRGSTIEARNGAWTLSGSYTPAGATIFRAARFGTPAASYTYVTTRVTAETTVRFDNNATFTEPTATVDGTTGRAMPAGHEICVQPNDNRLVIAGTTSNGGPHGATSSASHVWFSEPGDAESWLTSNFVQLTPGDNEDITAAVTWREFVIVFKRSRAFLFYGNSVDTTGVVTFNYRTLELPSRIPPASGSHSPIAVTGTDGVYFLTERGVYRTTGGTPQLVSQALDPLFGYGSPPIAWQGGTPELFIVDAGRHLAWHNERLYLSLPTTGGGTSSMLFVYDPTTGFWTYWNVPAAGMTSWAPNSDTKERLFFSLASGENRVAYVTPDVTTDLGTAITSRYRSGLDDLNVPAAEKDVTGALVWGTGSPTFKYARNWNALGTGATLTLGTSPAVAAALARNNPRPAQLLSFELSATSPWAVHRLDYYVRGQRPVGLRTP
jgi:hypothetical protein